MDDVKFNKWFDEQYGEANRQPNEDPPLYDLSDLKDAFEAGASSGVLANDLHNRAFVRRAIACLTEISRYQFNNSEDKAFCDTTIAICQRFAKQDSEEINKQLQKDL